MRNSERSNRRMLREENKFRGRVRVPNKLYSTMLI